MPESNITTLTREQARQIDELAINELGIPGIVLMENAGRNATDLIQRYMQEQNKKLTAALILCGGGNNGGDGFVVARHLHNRGVHVHILATKPIDQLTGDAKTNATICKNMNLPIHPAPGSTPGLAPGSTPVFPPRRGELQHAGLSSPLSTLEPDLIVDALLGTGFQGTLRPDMLQLIQAINATRDQPNPPTIVALDLPSGLDCNTGRPPETPPPESPPPEASNTPASPPPAPPRRGELQHAGIDAPNNHAVRADLTITFVAPKLGFSQPAAWPYLGKFQVADIGIRHTILKTVK